MAQLPKYNVSVNKHHLRRQISRVPTAKQLVHPPDKRRTSGYAQAANFIATDKELAVYRRFDRTAARALLNLQSEILSKQNQLDALDEEDANDPKETGFLSSATIYEELRERNPRDEEKNKLLGELRKLLKEYYELLSAQSDVLKFSEPPDRVKNALFGWLDNAQCLVGLGEQAYFEEHDDLVALRPAKGEDRLSQFLRDHCSHWMKKQRESHRQPWDRLYYLPETRISKAVGTISILMAGVLLVGAIISLYFVTASAARLGLLTVWTIVFALSVSILSTARRSEVFAATAAYAAVLVVFVSGNLASPGQRQ